MQTENAARGAYGQWLFARGVEQGLAIAAVVVSARGRRQADAPALVAGTTIPRRPAITV